MLNIAEKAQQQKNADTLIIAVFCYILLDSLSNYILRSFFSIAFPVNAALPIFFAVLVYKLGFNNVLPKPVWFLPVLVCCTGLAIGILFLSEIGVWRFVSMVAAVSTYIIGYAAARSIGDIRRFAKYAAWVSVLYVLVFIIAFKGLYPALFPMSGNEWLNSRGEVVIRPSVMANANIQIYYLIPAFLLLFVSVSLGRLLLAGIAVLGSVYVLICLQTRSGVMLCALMLGLATVAGLFAKRLSLNRLAVIPLFALALGYYVIENNLLAQLNIYERFVNDDFHNMHHRFYAVSYLLEKLADLHFWLPQGQQEFDALYGGLPHFNPTAFYLNGGILSLLGWLSLFLAPVIYVSFYLLFNKLSPALVYFYIGALVSLLAQLTLNMTYGEQTWLWAGAILGAINRELNQQPEESLTVDTAAQDKKLIFNWA